MAKQSVKVTLTAAGAGAVTVAVPVAATGRKALTLAGGRAVSTAAVSSSWLYNGTAGGAADATSLIKGLAVPLGALAATTPVEVVAIPDMAHILSGEVFTLTATFGAAGSGAWVFEFVDSALGETDILRDRAG